MEEKVLVLGDDTRSFLTIVRSLGRKGIKLHAAPANFRSPALYSRYIAKVHDVPPWLGEGAEWLASIAGLLRIERYDLVIPCNETVLLPLQHYRRELSAFARLAIPDDDAIAILFDKHNTRELARQIGVPVATGRLARPNDVAENVLTEFGGLLVVKPRRSYSLEKLATRGKAEVITDRARLTRLLSETAPNELVFEQFFYGNGIGISVLANRGRLLQAFEHHRVREIAGASFYRRSAPLTPELVQASEAIVAALDYTGIAMFEFKRSPDGSWILLEVNARPWGSMPLPVSLAIDFPYRWYRLLVKDEDTPAVTYRVGVYGRNLIPDLRQTLMEAQTRELRPIGTTCLLIGRFAESLRMLIGREVNDVLVRDDPRPGLLEFVELGRAVRRRFQKLWPGEGARRRQRARAQVQMLHETRNDPCILFVCQGNICRSPFAERLLRGLIGDSEVMVRSAGTMPQPGRSAPVLALHAAAEHGADLSPHRSTWLSRSMSESASLLIVFDDVNRSAVLDRYPDLRAPIVLLGDVAGLGEIPDPVDGDAAVFSSVYDQIESAITELTSLMRQNRRSRVRY
jgi:protein-tyrosine-phosphatase/predicted ATP-grasp superfamily ATP-dependent carboligase